MQLILDYRPPAVTTHITISEGFVPMPSRPILVVIDEKVPQELLTPFLSQNCLFMPGGEASKSRKMKETLEDELLRRGLGKDVLLIGIGGGALLDLVGFVAATYMRGVDLWIVPTTLLAMIDSGIGGKNGINFAGAKNVLGTVYQPERIMIETKFLEHLPLFELQNGSIEMIKHAFLVGEKLDSTSILQRDPKTLMASIAHNIEIKIRIVEESCRRPPIRELLNFGHTIGHALEAMEGFSISHGMAVAMGMLAESRLGALPQGKIDELESSIRQTGLPLKISRRYSRAEWRQAFSHDKKSRGGRPRFVLFDSLACPIERNGEFCHEVEDDKLGAVIEWTENQFVV